MSREELDLLSKEELIHLILEQAKQLAQLKSDYETLKLKLGQIQKKPPTNFKNSSQLPSKDQKGDQPKDRRRHRHGPPQGHEKHERKFVAQPDHVVDLRAQECKECHAELDHKVEWLVKVNQITEQLEAKPEVIEVRQYETICANCGKAHVEVPPVGLERSEPLALGWKRRWCTTGRNST